MARVEVNGNVSLVRLGSGSLGTGIERKVG